MGNRDTGHHDFNHDKWPKLRLNFAYPDLKHCSMNSVKASIQILSRANSLQIWVCANSVNHLKIYLRIYQLMESDSQERILPTQWFREIFLSLHSGKKTGSLIKIKPSISSFIIWWSRPSNNKWAFGRFDFN